MVAMVMEVPSSQHVLDLSGSDDPFILPRCFQPGHGLACIGRMGQLFREGSHLFQGFLLHLFVTGKGLELFILVEESRQQLLPTILSRVQCLETAGVSEEEALPLLKARLPDTPEEELRRALTVFDGCIGQVLEAMAGDLFPRVIASTRAIGEALLAGTEWPLLQAAAPLDRDTALQDGVLSGLCLLLRDALAAGQGQASRLSTAPDLASRLAQTFTGGRLMQALGEVQALQKDRLSNMSSPLLITLLSARLTAALRD